MKAFQHRVRQESKALLRASNVANSATQQRRREYMRKRKQEKKLKKKKEKGLLTYEEVEEHLAEQRERELLGGGRDAVAFGETNDAPPDLRALKLPRLGTKAKPTLLGDEGSTQKAKQQKKQPQQKARAANKPERTTAEKAAWARLREQAQAAYREMRAKQGQGPRL
jgi:hypothetical protein